MRPAMKSAIAVCLLAVAITIGLRITMRSAAPGGDFVSFTDYIMAAPISVLAPSEHAEAAPNIVFDTFRQVDAEMSEWKDTSPLSNVNTNAGVEPVEVPDDLRDILRRAIEIGELTDNAFAVTWAALWGVWDFKSPAPAIPDPGLIEQRVQLVDDTRIEIDDDRGTVYLPQEGMVVGLGGIAKGHALDLAASRLRDAGINDFLISGAGQIMVGGTRAGRPWRIGVRDPRGRADDYFAFIEITDTSLSTSGDYERFFMIDGVRYHHILDPRTGWPARGVRAVTVICPDATLADALSTAMLILGPSRSLEIAARLDSVDVILVDEDGELLVSDGLTDRLEIVRPPRP